MGSRVIPRYLKVSAFWIFLFFTIILTFFAFLTFDLLQKNISLVLLILFDSLLNLNQLQNLLSDICRFVPAISALTQAWYSTVSSAYSLKL